MEGGFSLRASDSENVKTFNGELHTRWRWFILLGSILLVIGFLAAIALPLSTIVVAFNIGLMMVLGGILQLLHAFAVKQSSRIIMWAIAGLLSTLAGILCFFQPLMAAAFFTLLLGVLLIVTGVLRLSIGLDNRGMRNWGWVVAAGCVTTLLGVLIVVGWPANSLWVLGLFLAIDFMFYGWSLIAFAIGLKNRA